MEPFIDRLLKYFEITKDEYIELTKPVNEFNFDEGHSFEGMDEVVKFVKEFVNNNKKIFIYGDYDTDGIMATSIMMKMFEYVGFKADYYVPSRYIDNYGLNVVRAKEIIDNKYDLVITVDNGITCVDAIKMLKDAGIAVCVFDHHERQEVLPEFDYLLHPLLSNFGKVNSSGAFVCFEFSKAFLGRYDKYLATLAAISLISDAMPLKEYNRNLLKNVINQYVPGEFENIDLLCDNASFDENVIGMKVSPRINSIGRIIEDVSINDMVDYFICDDHDKILYYFDWINSVNERRKEISNSDDNFEVNEDDPCFVLECDKNEGVIGLIATRICNKYMKPTIVFAKTSEDGVLKGSVRTPDGYNLMDIFDSLKDLVLTSGGHAHAGGCSIKEENFAEFKERFINLVVSSEVKVEQKECIDLYINDLTFENLEIVRSLSPYGMEMKAPVFKIKRIKTNVLTFSRNGEHIIYQMSRNVKFTGFNFPKEKVLQYPYLNFIGIMRKNEFRGFTSVEFLIQEIRIPQ